MSEGLSAHGEPMPPEAYTDELTGLLNRAWLERKLDQEIVNRPGEFALLFLDLDDLKKVNDESGHIAGNLLLQDTATILEDNIRRTPGPRGILERRSQPDKPHDTLALTGKSHAVRLHGDEFALLLTGRMTTNDLSSIKQRIQSSLSDKGIAASIGGRVHQGETSSELFEQADFDMRQNKKIRKEKHLQAQLEALPRWKRASFRIGRALLRHSGIDLPR